MSDLISRKDAIELMKNDMENNGLPLDDEYNIGIDHAMCLLACVPTAEPKVGRWIEDGVGDKCSECGMSFPDLYPLYNSASYCPNCGAKMDGEEKEDE